MTITTCDFCGKQLENGYGHKTDWKIRFSLMRHQTVAEDGGHHKVSVFQFNGVMSVTPEFSSSEVHWCEACISQAILKGTLE